MRRSTRWSLVAGLLALATLAGGCLPVPAHRGPRVSGVLVDATTGEPIPAAIVVVPVLGAAGVGSTQKPEPREALTPLRTLGPRAP